MGNVNDFVYQSERPFRDVLVCLHEMLVEQYGLKTVLRYRIPFYDRYKWICYLNPVRDRGIELAFIRGAELSNAQGILDPGGRKHVAGIILDDVSLIPFQALDEIIHEALLIDEQDHAMRH